MSSKFCTVCGAEQPLNQQFCTTCGARTPTSVAAPIPAVQVTPSANPSYPEPSQAGGKAKHNRSARTVLITGVTGSMLLAGAGLFILKHSGVIQGEVKLPSELAAEAKAKAATPAPAPLVAPQAPAQESQPVTPAVVSPLPTQPIPLTTPSVSPPAQLVPSTAAPAGQPVKIAPQPYTAPQAQPPVSAHKNEDQQVLKKTNKTLDDLLK